MLLRLLVPEYLNDLSGHHVVDVKVAMMLRADHKLLSAGEELGRLDGEVLEADRLYLGVVLPVYLEERGSGAETCHEPHSGLRVELRAPDHSSFVSLEVRV